MKLRKIISLIVTIGLIMTCMAIVSMPSVSAATKTGNTYSMNFGTVAYGYTDTLSRLSTYDWWAADNTQLFNSTSNSLYKAASYKFAQIVADPTGTANNYCLEVISAAGTHGTAGSYVIKNYGYGTTFPGVAANQDVSGAWEIEFYFIPNFNSSTGALENDEFAFTINTSAGPNNLVSSDGTNMILGQFNPTTASVPFSTAAINTVPLQKATYRVKAFLNIDQGYYSVELWQGGNLIARRSPITLNNTNVRFLKFSALGISSTCKVYVDNLSIKSAESSTSTLYADGREKLIYSDNFNAYTGNTAATTAMTSETTGTSFFPAKYTPWRVFANTGTNGNYSVTDGVLRIGKQNGTERSAMIYAIPGETIVNTSTEPTRGMLNVSFKINPADIKANQGFTLELGNAPSASTQTKVLILGLTAQNEPKIMHLDGTGTVLNPAHWYTVNMTVDVINRGIKFVVTDDDDSGAVVSSYVQAPDSGSYMTPTAIGEIMFRAGDNAGSYVYLDDVNISYVTPEPSVDTANIVMTDGDGSTVEGTTGVTTDIDEIVVPLGTIVSGTTISDFTLVDNDSNTITCTGTLNHGNAYSCGDTFTLSPSSALQSGKIYTLTVASTVASVYGDTLGTPATFTFTTAIEDRSDLMEITAVRIGGTAVNSLSDITAGSTINVDFDYVNSTADTINGTAIVAFYSGGTLVGIVYDDTTVAAGAHGTDTTTFALTVPVTVNMATVDKVSVFLWDDFINIMPYCEHLEFE